MSFMIMKVEASDELEFLLRNETFVERENE